MACAAMDPRMMDLVWTDRHDYEMLLYKRPACTQAQPSSSTSTTTEAATIKAATTKAATTKAATTEAAPTTKVSNVKESATKVSSVCADGKSKIY